MNAADRELADGFDLWMRAAHGARNGVFEHRLVAARKYGAAVVGKVVRHLNGIKTDNRPENIALGTTQENTMDHETARRQMLYWKRRCLKAEKELANLLQRPLFTEKAA